MKRLCGIAIVCALAVPLEAAAQGKSIFRFDRGPDREDTRKSADDEGTAPGDAEDPQVHPGSSRQGLYEEAGDETAYPVGPDEMAEAAGAGDAESESRLPGAPAVVEPVGPPPPLTLPRPDFGRAPSRSRTPRDATSAASDSGAAAPAPPRKQKPFTYAPAPRSQGTVTGYDAAVAPRTITLDPATPPVPAGPNAAPARPLPRLAPYGRSLPPSKSTPPASIPR